MLLQTPATAIQPGANHRGPNPTIGWIGADLVWGDVTHKDPYGDFGDERIFASHPLQHGEAAVATYGDFRKLAAASLSDAVEASSLLSAANPLHDGGNQSVGVLQAADGSYFATGLKSERWRDTNVGSVPEHMELSIDDTQKLLRVEDIQQRHPDLRAVVGVGSWVNFTNETIDPKLAG